MITFRGVSKQYPKSGWALRDVTLEVEKGEFLQLFGPSGAGKSTLLKLIYMEERPTQGEVHVAGFSSKHVTPRQVAQLRRRVGVIFQDFKLLPQRTAEENVAFALEVTGTPTEEVWPRVLRALAAVGLGPKRRNYPAELSGGEQQRVAIARALVRDPVILLADEPTGNLDPAVARDLLQILEEIHAAGTAVILATHHEDLVNRVGKRVVHLNQGQILYDSRSARGDGSAPAG